MSRENSRPKILLTGKTGQVGRELAGLLDRVGEVTAVDRQQLDLTKPDEIRRVVRGVRPNLIVNAAAYTAVDRAESDEAVAQAINGVAPGVLAEEAKRLGALLVHYSTDYIFDGTKGQPYEEDDSTNPLSRMVGELCRDGKIGALTSSQEIAAATVKVLERIRTPTANVRRWPEIKGIYHMTAGGETNWYEFAKSILELAASQSRPEAWLAAATRGRPLMTRRIVSIATKDTPRRRAGLFTRCFRTSV